MFEFLIMLALALLVGACAALYALPWETMLVVGLVLVGAGLAIGMPMGFWYHVLLYRALAPRSQLSRRWWINPVAHHPRLTEDEREPVMRWFYISASTFSLCVAGCAIVVLAVVRWSRY